VLVAGVDAAFTIDGIALTRSSNTVSDAISGVTLTLTNASTTASTDLSVTRDETTASDGMQVFVSAYNALVGFLKQQGTVTQSASDPTDSSTSTTTVPALYGDSLIRSVRSILPQTLLQPILGASSTLPTAASAGVSLAEDGTLTFDSTAFADAFNNHFNDLQAVFGETRTADNANVNFTSSGTATSSGTWDVDITAAATQASVSTSGFSGTYDAGTTPDSLTVTDTVTGNNATIALTTGMTTSDIITALQAAIAANGLGITATANGNDIQLTQQSYGSHSGITLAVTGTGDGASEAWAAGSTTDGTDVQGTIGGFAATGAGQTLVGASGTGASGLSLQYTGTDTGDMGNITLGLGVGAAIQRIMDTYTDPNTGLLAQRGTALTDQNSDLVDRVAQIDERLANERLALVAKYSAMEAAIAALKSATAGLLGTSSTATSTALGAAPSTSSSSSS
jgi:flagellar hook-associated protein 2